MGPFKINDKVKVISNSKLKGRIWDCWSNYEENLEVVDNEKMYVVAWDSRSKMVQFDSIKESDLTLIECQVDITQLHIFNCKKDK